jgi:serine/threonine protein kinase
MLGTRLGDRYQVTGEVGRGGMGVVYRARDPLLDREVAVKVVGAQVLDREVEERFVREARIVAKLDHPAIVSIYDIGKHDDRIFIVMPLVQGQTLRELVASTSPGRRRTRSTTRTPTASSTAT